MQFRSLLSSRSDRDSSKSLLLSVKICSSPGRPEHHRLCSCLCRCLPASMWEIRCLARSSNEELLLCSRPDLQLARPTPSHGPDSLAGFPGGPTPQAEWQATCKPLAHHGWLPELLFANALETVHQSTHPAPFAVALEQNVCRLGRRALQHRSARCSSLSKLSSTMCRRQQRMKAPPSLGAGCCTAQWPCDTQRLLHPSFAFVGAPLHGSGASLGA
mmetsp:Transcript_46254/g.108042  ORF Transcript_46254/g.108042 Transcript_46254/m.108042 type:complete len:216 (+) Transcript_46254:211-858(+)